MRKHRTSTFQGSSAALAAMLWCFIAAAGASATNASAATGGREAKRQKVIDFDDEVVEGVNKRPLDSVSQVSERDRKRHKPHLYRKRAGFRSETAETLRAIRFTP